MTITTRSRRHSRAVFALLAAALLAAACSDDPDTSQPPPGTEAPEPTFVTVEPADTTSATEPAVVETTVPDTTEAPEPAVVETTVPDTTEAPEPTADTVPADTTEADSEEPVTDDPDGDGPAGADEPDTTEAQPEDETSAGSVFPARAYFDHDAIRALFPNCPPPPGGSLADWIDDLFDNWDGVYAGWDTDSERLSGLQIASGWWTDEQLALWRPGSGITAASARRDGTYDRKFDTVKLWPVGPAPTRQPVPHSYGPHKWADGTFSARNLYLRAESRGYASEEGGHRSTAAESLTHIRDDGMPGNAPNPTEVDAGMLLLEWTLYRYTQPPTTGEPAAYVMRTLLEAHEPNCVAAQMRSICDYDGEITEPLLGRDDRFGRVLWSLVCPEA